MNNYCLNENDALQYNSTFNYNLDLFLRIGNDDFNDLFDTFKLAYNENKELSAKILMYSRSIKNGMGRRDNYIKILNKLNIDFINDNFNLIVNNGYYKDLLKINNLSLAVLSQWAANICIGNYYAMKWAPRLNSKYHKTAILLKDILNLTNKEYRNIISCDSTEKKMCQQLWDTIDYSKMTSKNTINYSPAFLRHDMERFIDSSTKLKANILMPYEIYDKILKCNHQSIINILDDIFDNLPNFIPDNIKAIPICNVSSSMTGLPMRVSISLGIYMAQRLPGGFKNKLITFSANPSLIHLESNRFSECIEQVSNMEWGYNTNFEATMNLILDTAIMYDIPQNDMPTHLFCFTDMQFDQVDESNSIYLDATIDKYKKNNYYPPVLVMWNLRINTLGSVRKSTDKNTVLVSGFSTAIMKHILSGDFSDREITYQKKTPESRMLSAIQKIEVNCDNFKIDNQE